MWGLHHVRQRVARLLVWLDRLRGRIAALWNKYMPAWATAAGRGMCWLLEQAHLAAFFFRGWYLETAMVHHSSCSSSTYVPMG